MNFEYIISKDKLKIDGPLLLKPKVFSDSRGFFFESWNQMQFDKIVGQSLTFVQDNHSRSSKGVIRGLHFQESPYQQDKLVRCISGKIFDVIVDIRQNSPTFSKWFGVLLSSDNFFQLWIPKGFAHGFLTLSSTAEVVYKTTDYWEPSSERTLIWNDANLNIVWPIKKYQISNPIISSKDKNGICFSEI